MKLRIKFTKHGAVRYIGHLDMQRYFQRVNRRAGIPVVYSGGFSPHQKMAFAMPLSVGCESDGEYFDLEVSDALSSDDIVNRMNKEMAEGIEVIDCVLLPEKCENAMSSVRGADYSVTFKEGYKPAFDMESTVSDFMDSEEFIIKKAVKNNKKKKSHVKQASYNTKTMSKDGRNPVDEKSEYKEINLRPLVHDIFYDGYIMRMKVSAGSKDNVKPELVIKVLYEKAGMTFSPQALMITRGELYTYDQDGNSLITLLSVGDRF